MNAPPPVGAAPVEPTGSSAAPAESPQELQRDVAAVGRLEVVPLLLEVLCETTGMGFAAVARVSDVSWTLCAVNDLINFGLRPGGQLDLETTLCIEAKRSRSAIVIDHASQDLRYCSHPTPQIYKIESYVSVPIILGSGRYFGNLCAIDPRPAKVSEPKVIGMFERFAQIISLQLEAELKHQQSETALRDERASNELSEQLMAILGHDLRNPLQAVAVTTEVMRHKATDPDIQDLAARIAKNVRRMSGLIDHILDFARMKLGGGLGVTVAEQGTQLNGPIRDVIREFQDGHPDRQIAVEIDVARPVRCDVGRIQQLISNLVGNALSHGDPDRPVRVTAMTQANDFVLAVFNEGDPIPEDSLPKIFDPFWRRAIGSHRAGLGLGLSICSQIVRGHGGTLSVTSNHAAGTTFTARLPL